jgi:glycosyltransferase involved in cell wall biosynthesis
MNKVLIITYYWPPSGGAGVQRWLKFAKYLPEYGWEPVILTIDKKYAAYPVTDDSLVEDIPQALRIYTTPATDYFSIYGKNRSKIPAAGFANNSKNSLKDKFLRFIRGNFFIPDPRKGWNRYAFRKACKLIESENIRHVITTSPPHSTQLIGLKIRKKYKFLKWIADIRDPWTDIYYYNQFYHTVLAKYIDARFEKKVLVNADTIITVGKSLKSSLSQKASGIERKIEVITNGYDESDFKKSDHPQNDIFTVSYIGTLSDAYPVGSFLQAFHHISEKKNDCRLRFIGSVSGKQQEHILSELPDTNVDFIEYVNHASAIGYMRQSTVLLLIIPNHKSNKSIITGKLFEYIASGRPVICIGPFDGDAAEIITKSKCGRTFYYEDTKGISDYLSILASGDSDEMNVENNLFSRRKLTEKLASVLGN